MYIIGIFLTDIFERQSCHTVVGAMYSECIVLLQMYYTCTQSITSICGRDHINMNARAATQRVPYIQTKTDCKTCSNGYLGEILKSCLENKNGRTTTFRQNIILVCAYHKMTFETLSLVNVMLFEVSENRFYFFARGCQNTM